MPGVPSGRGCDACRKQKKKCDQGQPSCSRCTRLQIPCIGSGERRFKFKDQSEIFRARSKGNSSKDSPSPSSSSSSSSSASGALVRVPSNQLTTVANALIAQLETQDIRYDLTCYGTFLDEIPRRLGRNRALDASVGALTVCYSSLHNQQNSLRALESYVRALKALRVVLNDPANAQTPDTLCAIYFIMIVQGWIGRKDDQCTSHGEGIAHILKAGAAQKWDDPFAVEILITLCIPVIIESIANPRIQLKSWFTQLLDLYGPPKSDTCDPPPDSEKMMFRSLRLRKLARFPEFVANPEVHLAEIRQSYDAMRIDQANMKDLLAALDVSYASSSQRSPPGPEVRMHRNYQTAYGILISLCLVSNTILMIYNPEDPVLAAEAVAMAQDILVLAQTAAKYRPLGASYMPLCLATVWGSTQNLGLLQAAEFQMMDYQRDFISTEINWMDIAVWWKVKFETMRMNRMPPMLLQDEVYVQPMDPGNVMVLRDDGTGRKRDMCVLM